MNKTRIEWCDYSWNPIVGCVHGCTFCYARATARRFGPKWGMNPLFFPQFFPGRLTEPLAVKKPSIIFADSMSDMFGEGVEYDWVVKVMATISRAPQHRFVILTKSPERIPSFIDWEDIPDNVWLGVSVNYKSDEDRIAVIQPFRGVQFVSFEPLLDDISYLPPNHEWVIVGGQTGAKPVNCQTDPRFEERLDRLVLLADERHIPMFIKSNAKYPLVRKEFPAGWGDRI
jgi:protein gp37